MRHFKIVKILFLSAVLAFSLVSLANAAPISAITVTGSGAYNNSATLLTDGVIPAESTSWTAGTNVWWYGTTPAFTLDFGSAYTLTNMLIQVDNNDTYQVQYSTNGSIWTNLFAIPWNAGNIGWGMDTFTQAEITFNPVAARYVKVFATDGDNCYSISEVQAFGSAPTATPEPATMLLFGLGLMGLAGIGRKMKK